MPTACRAVASPFARGVCCPSKCSDPNGPRRNLRQWNCPRQRRCWRWVARWFSGWCEAVKVVPLPRSSGSSYWGQRQSVAFSR